MMVKRAAASTRLPVAEACLALAHVPHLCSGMVTVPTSLSCGKDQMSKYVQTVYQVVRDKHLALAQDTCPPVMCGPPCHRRTYPCLCQTSPPRGPRGTRNNMFKAEFIIFPETCHSRVTSDFHEWHHINQALKPET